MERINIIKKSNDKHYLKFISENLFEKYDIFARKYIEDKNSKKNIKTKFKKIFLQQPQLNSEKESISNEIFSIYQNLIDDTLKTATLPIQTMKDKYQNNLNDEMKIIIYSTVFDLIEKHYSENQINLANESLDYSAFMIFETAHKYLKNKNIVSPMFNQKQIGKICNIFGLGNYNEPNILFRLFDIDTIIITRISRIIHYSLLYLVGFYSHKNKNKLIIRNDNDKKIQEKIKNQITDSDEKFRKLIYNEMESLSNILNISMIDTKLYYSLFLSYISKPENINSNLNEIEKWKELLKTTFKEKHEDILLQIKQNKQNNNIIEDSILLLNKDPISNLTSKFLKPKEIDEYKKKYQIISFFLENYSKLKILNLFPSFLKFSSIIHSKYSGKHKFETIKFITIKDVLKEINQNYENIEKWKNEFIECWIYSLSEINQETAINFNRKIKYIDEKDKEIEYLTELMKIEEINETTSISKFLPYPENQINIETIIRFVCKLQHDLKQQIKTILFKEKEKEKEKENIKKKKINVLFPFKVDLLNKETNVVDSDFNFGFKEINEHLKFHNINNFDDFENLIKQKLIPSVLAYDIFINVENFQFKDKVIVDTSFFGKIEWGQVEVPTNILNELLDNLKANSQLSFFSFICEDLINLCSDLDSEQKQPDIEKSLSQFIDSNNYKPQQEISNIFKNNPKLKSIMEDLKIKHLRSIYENIQKNLTNIIEQIDPKYKKEPQTNNLENFREFIKEIDLTKLLMIFQTFFQKLVSSPQIFKEDDLLKDCLKREAKSKGFNELAKSIKENIQEDIEIKFSVKIYEFCLNYKLNQN
ncbi:hypothetical protein M0811_02200 [Anaeramoeba ignava]|uniref:Uncharacterized protein n=1 Tax=Anaeramoeba ignava TaxID=1746090 RepID=A0A9Q0LCZ8_ANAIG|nr:hypothetical protein M0811_02200 [Anaeramoeba ignava]